MRESVFVLVSEQWPKDSSMPKMSGQRSDWRERLRANPSRMEQDLTIKLQDDQIRYLTQVEISATIVDLYFPLEPRPLLHKPFSSLQTSPRLLLEECRRTG